SSSLPLVQVFVKRAIEQKVVFYPQTLKPLRHPIYATLQVSSLAIDTLNLSCLSIDSLRQSLILGPRLAQSVFYGLGSTVN
ncbi:hypothetical protein ACTGYZ_01905, partial [Streptococcus suis]